jgi:hypothetical protein
MERNRKKSEHDNEANLISISRQQQQQQKRQQQEQQNQNGHDRVKESRKREAGPDLPEPVFQIGGKTDPDRFSSAEKPFFFRIGFHDDERSDTTSPILFRPRDRVGFFDAQRRILMERIGVSGDFIKIPRATMTTSASATSLRSTLSPVHEVTPSAAFETIDASEKKLCPHSDFNRVRCATWCHDIWPNDNRPDDNWSN